MIETLLCYRAAKG